MESDNLEDALLYLAHAYQQVDEKSIDLKFSIERAIQKIELFRASQVAAKPAGGVTDEMVTRARVAAHRHLNTRSSISTVVMRAALEAALASPDVDRAGGDDV